MSTLIEGVEIKELKVHKDERGFFCEIIRNSDKFFKKNFAQLSCSVTFVEVAKAWHLHKKLTYNFACLYGAIKLAFYKNKKNLLLTKSSMFFILALTIRF